MKEMAPDAQGGIMNLGFQKDDETELQTRSRLVKNAFREDQNCIILRVDTHINSHKGVNPFGFHFEMDKKRYVSRKKQIRREKITQWLSWLAYYHHKFGIRHLLLVVLLTGYVFLGGMLFNKLESKNELDDLKETLVLMQGIIREMSVEAINVTLVEVVQKQNYTVGQDKMGKLIKRYYKEMLEAEGRFHGSVWHKAENLELHLMWYFSSATFYAMTLFTTIGYGTITCQTFWGRFMSIIYASIGIPLMLVTLGDVGEWFQKIVTKAYVWVLVRYKKVRNQAITRPLEEIYLPIYYALGIVTVYILLCTLIIKEFDRQEGNKPGIDFGSALYFVFISLTTIGLGDVMPYNIQYSPFLSAAFLLGLAMVSIVNTSIYAVLYEIFFERVEKAENWLDRIHRQHNKPEGWAVFCELEPAFRTLALSFPHSEKTEQQRLMTILNHRDGGRDKKPDISRGIAGMLAKTLWTTANLSDYQDAPNDVELGNGRPPSSSTLSNGHLTVPNATNDDGKRKVGFHHNIVRVRTNSDLAAHDPAHSNDLPTRIPSFKARRRAPTLGAFDKQYYCFRTNLSTPRRCVPPDPVSYALNASTIQKYIPTFEGRPMNISTPPRPYYDWRWSKAVKGHLIPVYTGAALFEICLLFHNGRMTHNQVGIAFFLLNAQLALFLVTKLGPPRFIIPQLAASSNPFSAQFSALAFSSSIYQLIHFLFCLFILHTSTYRKNFYRKICLNS
ncbi:unnamed protein product, partial [Mesorhabditis spiculigera]